MTPKKIPVRRCVGCGEGKPKRELIRLVRTAEGEISVDPTGRKAGRGAYICRSSACFERARKRKSLERAFAAAIPEEAVEQLAEQVRQAEAEAEDSDE